MRGLKMTKNEVRKWINVFQSNLKTIIQYPRKKRYIVPHLMNKNITKENKPVTFIFRCRYI